jgi:hypothetical protein
MDSRSREIERREAALSIGFKFFTIIKISFF